jgi:hypothetical protein
MMSKIFLTVVLSTMMLSCEKDSLFLWDDVKRGETGEESYVYSPSPVFDVIGPSAMKLGETVTIQVRSQGNSGCAEFSNFRQSVSGRSTTNIQVIQKIPEEAICTMAIITLTSSYEFTPETRGKHTLNFWRGELHNYDFITLEINVK